MSGERDLWLQETRGVEVDPSTPMFVKSDVDWLFDEENRYARLPYVNKREIFTLVDPNAGGLSNYAIASFVRAEGFTVLVGLEEKNTKDPIEQRTILIQHIRQLLGRADLARCIVVLGVESNLGYEADHHSHYITSEGLDGHVCVLHESHRANMTDAAVGLHTTNTTKATMGFLTQYDLQHRRFRIADTLTCVSGHPKVLLPELQGQLQVFCRMVEPAQRLGGKPRIIYTGKHVRSHDDLAIVFQMFSLANNHFNGSQGRITYAQWHVAPPAA